MALLSACLHDGAVTFSHHNNHHVNHSGYSNTAMSESILLTRPHLREGIEEVAWIKVMVMIKVKASTVILKLGGCHSKTQLRQRCTGQNSRAASNACNGVRLAPYVLLACEKPGARMKCCVLFNPDSSPGHAVLSQQLVVMQCCQHRLTGRPSHQGERQWKAAAASATTTLSRQFATHTAEYMILLIALYHLA
jgi:hypothetical protein